MDEALNTLEELRVAGYLRGSAEQIRAIRLGIEALKLYAGLPKNILPLTLKPHASKHRD